MAHDRSQAPPSSPEDGGDIARTRSYGRETHELHRIRFSHSDESTTTTTTDSSDSPSPSPVSRVQTQRSSIGGGRSSIGPPPKGFARVPFAVKEFWRHQISIVVGIDKSRDHLAVERTFLGYLRTSQALSMFGVIVAQLFTLQGTAPTNSSLTYAIVGKPLAAACQGVAMYILILGAYRWWRQQKTMLRGNVIVGGFELYLIGLIVMLVVLLFFALMIAIDVKITSS